MRLDHLIAYLEKAAPEVIKGLRTDFPEFAKDFLSTDARMGGGDAGNAEPITPRKRKLVIATIERSVPVHRKDLATLSTKVAEHVSQVQDWKAVAALTTTASALVGAACAVWMISQGAQQLVAAQVATFVTSLVAATGGGFTFLAETIVGRSSGLKRKPTSDDLAKIGDARSEIEQVAAKIGRDALFPLSTADLGKALDVIDRAPLIMMKLGFN